MMLQTNHDYSAVQLCSSNNEKPERSNPRTSFVKFMPKFLPHIVKSEDPVVGANLVLGLLGFGLHGYELKFSVQCSSKEATTVATLNETDIINSSSSPSSEVQLVSSGTSS